MRTIKLNQDEANKIYESFQSLMFSRIKELVERYCPKYAKDLKMGKDSEYITCGNAFVEPTIKLIPTITGQREIAAWAVGYSDEEFGDITYVEEGTNSWAIAARKFVMMLIEDDMNSFYEVRMEFYHDGQIG